MLQTKPRARRRTIWRGGADFSMAFQPIYDVAAERVWGYEALVRGSEGEGAHSVLSRVSPADKYIFDQACRKQAIALASRLFPPRSDLRLSVNILPNAVHDPEAGLEATIAAARAEGFPTRALMFEFTENEAVLDPARLHQAIAAYRRRGILTALDDFGAGYAGLGLLADFQPDLIKIDMHLVRGVDTSRARATILAAIVTVARELGINVLAEGVESEAEFLVLKAGGIKLFQGYWFARPAFEALPPIEAETGRGMLVA